MKYLFSSVLLVCGLIIQAQSTIGHFIRKFDGTGNYIIKSSLKSSDGIFYVGTMDVASAPNGKLGIMYRTDFDGNFETGKVFSGLDRITDICRDASGNYYIGGSTYISSKKKEAAVAKIDKDGNYLWPTKVKYYGSTEDETVQAMLTLNNGNILVTGASKSYTYASPNGIARAALVLCINPTNGTPIWNKTFGGVLKSSGGYSREMARRATQMKNNDISITGITDAIGAGQSDVLHMMFKQDGTPVEVNAYGSTSNDEGFDIDYVFDGPMALHGDGYLDICGKANIGSSNEEKPLWIRVHYTTSWGTRTYTGHNTYKLVDQNGNHDLDKLTRVRNNVNNVFLAGSVENYGAFSYRYNSTSEISGLYPQAGSFDNVVGLLGSNGAPKYVVTTENNSTDRCYLHLTDDNLQVGGCSQEEGNINRASVSLTRTHISGTSIYINSQNMNHYNQTIANPTAYSVTDHFICGEGFSKIYTDGLNSSSLVDQLNAQASLVNQNNEVVVLSRKEDTYPSSTYSSAFSLAIFDEFGNITSEKTFEMATSGQTNASFTPKSFIEKSANKYIVVGNYNYQYTDPVTQNIVDDQDVMLLEVNYSTGTITTKNRYQFSTGDGLERVKKIIAARDINGTVAGYTLLCAAQNSADDEDTRMVILKPNFSVYKKGVCIEDILSSNLFTVHKDMIGIDMIQLGNGGSILIAGQTKDLKGGFLASIEITANGGELDWIRTFNSGQYGYKKDCDFKKLIYNGTHAVAAFDRDGDKNGFVHIEPSNGDIYTIGSTQQCVTFTRSANITDLHLVNNDYLITSEYNNGNTDLVTLRTKADGTLKWITMLEFDQTEYGKFGVIKDDRYWSIASTESHHLLYNGTGNIPHLMINEMFIERGEASLCSSTSTTNIGNDNIDIHTPTQSDYDFYEFDAYMFYSTETFNKETVPTVSSILCRNSAVGQFIPVIPEGIGSSTVESFENNQFTTGEKETLLDQTISVFPNPTHNTVNIKITSNEGTARILNIEGKEVIQNVALNKGNTSVELTDLTKGIYIIEVTTENQFFHERLIKK